MKTDLFDFDLPQAAIALRPAVPRDAARLLCVDGARLIDRQFLDLPDLLAPGDLLVFNDTRVIPARLTGRRGTAKVELTLHQARAPDRWVAFARPARKLAPGDEIAFADGFVAWVAAKGEGGQVDLRFDRGGTDLMAALAAHGTMPLPPYISRRRAPDDRDQEDYQTILAARDGAVAAPTAALHFTDRILGAITERGIATTTVTLHVGAGTFLPVKVEDTDDHHMHGEWGEVTEGAARAITETRTRGGRVVAVGTTSLRLLESAADATGAISSWSGETRLFITPGFEFRVVDGLLTNFHLPKSTLFMLVAAFSGLERMKAAYAHAVAAGYRFYSYGDASLLWPRQR